MNETWILPVLMLLDRLTVAFSGGIFFIPLKRPSLNKSGGLQQWLLATYSVILGPAEAFWRRDETFFKKPQGRAVGLHSSKKNKEN